MMSRMAIQKFGSESPRTPTIWTSVRTRTLRDTLAATPSGMPTTATLRTASSASSIVIGSRDTMRAATGWPVRNDQPKFPRSMFPIHRRYWTGSGWSRPNSRSTAARCARLSWPSVPAMMSTMLPGRRRTRKKIRTETPRMARTVQTARRAR